MSTPIVNSSKAEQFLETENKFSAHNYHPLPVVLNKGKGVFVWDVEGKKYYDFLSGYSSINQGHGHPKILQTFLEQAQILTLTSRAFHNDQLGPYAKFITQFFGYDKVLPMNIVEEAVETALHICRRWAYRVKGVAVYQAKIITSENNFHGRSLNVTSFGTDPTCREVFGPFKSG